MAGYHHIQSKHVCNAFVQAEVSDAVNGANLSWDEATKAFEQNITSCNVTDMAQAIRDPDTLAQYGVELRRYSLAENYLLMAMLIAQVRPRQCKQTGSRADKAMRS